jgi:hypothetical protein
MQNGIVRIVAAIVFASALAACGTKQGAVTNPPPVSSGSDQPMPPPATGSGDPAICGTRGAAACPNDQFCQYAPEAACGETDKPGHCAAKPRACPRIARPVCGCNGQTYGNSCDAAAQGMSVKADGACK